MSLKYTAYLIVKCKSVKCNLEFFRNILASCVLQTVLYCATRSLNFALQLPLLFLLERVEKRVSYTVSFFRKSRERNVMCYSRVSIFWKTR